MFKKKYLIHLWQQGLYFRSTTNDAAFGSSGNLVFYRKRATFFLPLELYSTYIPSSANAVVVLFVVAVFSLM